MRRFKLRDGEQTLAEYNVAVAWEGKARLARMVLTSERIVVAMDRRRFASWIGLVWRHLAPKELLQVAYEIRRERFASVEAGDGGVLVFRDCGEGYAHVSFTLTPDLLAGSLEPQSVWHDRLTAWASSAAG